MELKGGSWVWTWIEESMVGWMSTEKLAKGLAGGEDGTAHGGRLGGDVMALGYLAGEDDGTAHG